MKQFVGAVLAVALMAGLGMAAENKVELKSTKDKVSYAIGARIAQDLSRQKLDLTPEMVAAGLKDAMAGGKMLLTEEESRTVLMDFQKELMAAREAEMKAVGEKNAKEGKAFLAANAKKKGVVTLPSGLQYKIITKGKGNSPGKDDTVTVNYRGTLIDGKEFDSSYKRGNRRLSGERRDSRLDRGVAVDEGRFQVGALYPGRPGLRRTRCRRCHRPQCDLGV